MTKPLFALLLLAVFAVPAAGQAPSPGNTLISVLTSRDTYLIDLDYTILQTWTGSSAPATFAYPLEDGSVIRPCVDPGGTFSGGGVGGRLQKIDAANTIVWDYYFSTADYQQHHDIQPMPNGNVLVIAWERKTRAQAIAAGRQNISDEMWPTMIAEIEPAGATGGTIVWEWHLWDHLVQDADSTKANFGVIADNPQLVDINYGAVSEGSWDHGNSIDYNPALDQIVYSARKMNEFYIIDHSTTTEEAAGHTGGNSGRGGDILYRWGNPQVYDRGDAGDQYYWGIHGADWIDAGCPGAGNILTFNNGDRGGTANDYSSVEEFVLPTDGYGNYFIEPGEPFGPPAPVWHYDGPPSFFGVNRCGAFRLPNGNTLVTVTDAHNIFEVTPAGSKVWVYIAPGAVHRAPRYWHDAVSAVADTPVPGAHPLENYPNPFEMSTRIRFSIQSEMRVILDVYDTGGRTVARLLDGVYPAGEQFVTWDGSTDAGTAASSGIYFYRLRCGTQLETRKMILLR